MDYPTGVRPHGNHIEISYQYKGKRYFETLAKKPNNTNLAYAAKLRQQRIDRLRLGLATHEQNAPTFFELANDYLNNLEAAHSTVLSYRHALNKYWLPALASIPVNAITFRDLKQVDNKINWSSGRTRKNCIVPLRQVFAQAVDDLLIEYNPAANFRNTKHQKPPLNPFTPQEKAAILSALTGQPKVFFTLAFETGARTGELLCLTWADYQQESLTINKSIVRRRIKHSTKTNKARTVLLTQAAQKALNHHPTRFKKDFIFLNTQGGPHLDADMFNRAWKEALKTAGVEHRIAYNCRHTYASLALTAGVNPAFIANQLGHGLEMTLNIYGKYINTENDKLELAKLEGNI